MAQDGRLDSTFLTNGITGFSPLYGQTAMRKPIAVQPDGKIIQIGTGNLQATATIVVRFKVNGGVDSTFGTNGTVVLNCDMGNVQVQNDGKILVGGGYDSSGIRYFGIARLLPAGALDNGFGINGRRLVLFAPKAGQVAEILAQPDGKILVGGWNLAPGNNSRQFAICRLDAAGNLDPSFGIGGKMTEVLSGSVDVVEGLLLQPDNKIIALGYASAAYPVLLRYNSDGSRDNSFGTNGKIVVPNPEDATAIALQPDGKIVLAGNKIVTSQPTFSFMLLRFKQNGVLDSSFGTNGSVVTTFGGYNNYLNSIGVQADGKIVACGHFYYQAGSYSYCDMALARYKNNGVPDSSFGSNGKSMLDLLGGIYYEQFGMVKSQGSKIIVGSNFFSSDSSKLSIVRLKNNVGFYSPQITPAVISGPTILCLPNSIVLSSSITTGVQWYRDSILISGAVNPTLTVSQPGKYQAVVNSMNGSSAFSNEINVTASSAPSAPVISISVNTLTSSAASGNQWHKNGNIITGATGQTYIATSAGLYTATFTNNGCTSPQSNAINFVPSAVGSILPANEYVILPNPVHDRLLITSYVSKNLVVEIRDMMGKTITERLRFSSRLEVNMSGYARGSYLVIITDLKTKKQEIKTIHKM